MTLPMQLPAFLAADNPLGHVLDKPGVLGPLSMNSITLLVVTVLFILVMNMVANAIAVGPESTGNERFRTKGKVANLIEVIVDYLLNTVIRPQLGHDAKKFAPFLLTIFFFILFIPSPITIKKWQKTHTTSPSLFLLFLLILWLF